jgi:hypothetical protein
MNEPNTPDDGDLIQPLNSASPMSSEQSSCPFYTVIPTESFAINFSVSEQQEPGAGKELESDSDVILPHQYRDSEDEDLESIFTADDGYWHNHTGETDSAQNPGDWVTETDAEKQAAVNSEFQQLLKLNQELRQANEDLYQQVERNAPM